MPEDPDWNIVAPGLQDALDDFDSTSQAEEDAAAAAQLVEEVLSARQSTDDDSE
jgi:hypothetical protein